MNIVSAYDREPLCAFTHTHTPKTHPQKKTPEKRVTSQIELWGGVRESRGKGGWCVLSRCVGLKEEVDIVGVSCGSGWVGECVNVMVDEQE